MVTTVSEYLLEGFIAGREAHVGHQTCQRCVRYPLRVVLWQKIKHARHLAEEAAKLRTRLRGSLAEDEGQWEEGATH
eukprot:3940294-Rhodomonas_salina.2